MSEQQEPVSDSVYILQELHKLELSMERKVIMRKIGSNVLCGLVQFGIQMSPWAISAAEGMEPFRP